MCAAMSGKLFEGANEVCQVAAGVARHLLWYLGHQVGGDGARAAEPASPQALTF